MTDDLSTSEYVARAADLYTHINDLRDALGQKLEQPPHYHLGLQYATEALGDKLQAVGVDASWRLLDLCSGWGGPTRYLASRFGCQITGVDITQRSVDLARSLSEGSDVASLVSFRQGSALDIPLGARDVDLVWSQDALCHVPERHRAIEECFRVLRPGGYLVFTDWLKTDHITTSELEAFATAWSFPTLETMAGYEKMLATTGFDVVSAEGVGREYAAAGETFVLGRGGPSFIQRTASRDDDNVRQVVEAFGHQAHLDRLEREKMDIYFAMGKLELGRFVCRKPVQSS